MGSVVRLAALGTLALAVACGTAASPAPTTAPGAAAQTGATVRYKDFQVDPKTVTVRAGQSVRFENADGSAHTVTSGTPGSMGKAFETQQVRGGASAAVVFDKAGTYDYFCEFHASMTGKVVVN
ncbi:MAG TPA: cupredoxin domain-containing protein [Candidatus Limnocylindria bacterium]|nr:cupredoxin domain-containing protein [Candidatus Limnocylindria bacterium]